MTALEALHQANYELSQFLRDMERRYGTRSRGEYLERDRIRFDELNRAYSDAFNRVVYRRRNRHTPDEYGRQDDRYDRRTAMDDGQMLRLLRFRNRSFDEQLQAVRTFLRIVDNDGDGVIDAEELIGHCPLLSSFVAIQQGYRDDFRIAIDELASMILGILRDNDLAAVELLDCPSFVHAEDDAPPVHAPVHYLDAFRSVSRDHRRQVVRAYLHAVDDDENDEISDEELRRHCPSMADVLNDAFPEEFPRGLPQDVVADTIVDVIAENPTHHAVAELLNSQTFDFAWTQCETFDPRARPAGDDARPGEGHLRTFLALSTAEQEQRVSEMLLLISDDGVVNFTDLSEHFPLLAHVLLDLYDEALLHGINHAVLASGIVEFVVRGLRSTPRHEAVDEFVRSQVFQLAWAPPEHTPTAPHHAPTALHAPPEPFGDDFDFERTLNGLALENSQQQGANLALNERAEGLRRAKHQNTLDKQGILAQIGQLEADVALSSQSGESLSSLVEDIDQALEDAEPYERARRAIVEKRARIHAQLERVRSSYEVVNEFADADRVRNERRSEWERLTEADRVRRLRLHSLDPTTTPDPRLEFAPIPKPPVVQILEDLDAQLNAQLEAIDRHECADMYASHSDDEAKVEEADAVIYDDGTVECKNCFGYGVLMALKAYVTNDIQMMTSTDKLDQDMNIRLRTRLYRESAVVQAADLHLLVPDAVRRLLLRGKTLVACKQMDRMRQVKELSRQILANTEQDANVDAQLHDLNVELEAGRRRLHELIAREEHMRRAWEAALARAAQAARNAAEQAAAAERARVAEQQARERRERRAAEQERERQQRVEQDRAQAARDELLGRQLANNAHLDQQCPTCGFMWMWNSMCATMHCEGCIAARRPSNYCYYCKAGPWAVEGTESNAHIFNCRFNPLQNDKFPRNKKKEAVIRAYVRNAVAFLQGLARSHSASVVGHAIRCMRGRFLDDNFVSDTFLENYGINNSDELLHERNFTHWFDEECRRCNIPVDRHGAYHGGGRTRKKRPTRGTTPLRIRSHPTMGHTPSVGSTRPTQRRLSPRGSSRAVRRTGASATMSMR